MRSSSLISRRGRMVMAAFAAVCISAVCSSCLDTDEFRDAPKDGGGAKDGSSGSGGSSQQGGSGGTDAAAGGADAGAGGFAASGGTGGSGGAAGALQDVQGTQYLTYITNKETVVKPDLSGVEVKALVDNSGTFQTFKGSGKADGSFVIPGVPAGDYYLALSTTNYANTYYVTDQRNIDLGYYLLGRSSAVTVTKSTPLSLNISNMTSWLSQDVLDLFSAGAGLVAYNIETTASPPLTVGATSVNFTIDMATLPTIGPAPLLATTDQARVLHRRHVTNDAGLGYDEADSFAILSPVGQIDGQSSSATGSFVPVDQNKSLSVNWHLTEFEALKAAIHPSATLDLEALDVSGLPGKLSYGQYSASVDVLQFFPTSGQNLTASFSYGSPFDATWVFNCMFWFQFSVPYSLPGSTTPAKVAAYVIRFIDTAAVPNPVVPALSPATNATIDGKSFGTDVTVSSATPVVSWDPPTIGVPTRYSLSIGKLELFGSVTKRTYVGTVATPRTTVRIPPGVLQSGQSYVIILRAEMISNADPNKPPESKIPFSSADTLSGILTVP